MIKPSQVKTIQLVCCGQGFNREYQGHYNRYKIIIIFEQNGKMFSEPIENLYSENELKKLTYWVNKSRVMAMTVWGSSQEFEAKVSLGYFLKLDTSDWSAFCRNLDNLIKVIY